MNFYNVNKKFLLVILLIISAIIIICLPKLFLNKQEELPEVKLNNIEKEKGLAIMVTSESGNGYKEYEGNDWPKDDYYYSHSECIDNNGKKIEDGITFNAEKNTATLNTNKTIYCTLYFDKYNYMRVITKQIIVGSSSQTVPVYMSDKIKHIYFVDYIKEDLNENEKDISWWDISDTSEDTSEKSVIAWTEAISNDTGYDNLYIGSKNIIRVTSFLYAFKAAKYDESSNPISNLESIDFNDRLDTSKTTSLMSLFYGNKSLTKITGLGNWDVSKVVNMDGMFWDCQSLESIDLNNWHTESLESVNSMFVRNFELKNVNIKDWNTQELKSTQGMFHRCSSLASIDLSGWETPKIEGFSDMFIGCGSLKNIDMRNFTFTNIPKENTTKFNILFSGVPNTAILIVKDNAQKQWIEDTASATQFKGTIQIAN